MEKIRYRDLSWVLKVAIVFSWIIGGIWLLYFLIGLIEGTLLR